jgi:hypothetical protein
MELINTYDQPQKYQPDFIFINQNEEIVLLVEVKAKRLEQKLIQAAISQLHDYWINTKKNIPFGMLVDWEEINIFQFTEERNNKKLICLKTSDILSTYDPEFSQKRIFDFYLETLVKSWLRDLAYHWNLDIPPGSQELTEIGLLSLLEGGHTFIQEN